MKLIIITILAIIIPISAYSASSVASFSVGASVVYKHTAKAQEVAINCTCGGYIDPVVTKDDNTITFTY